MDAIELEKQINEKFGEHKDHKINENFKLIRTLETNEIVILDLDSPKNGNHLLKDASQEEIKNISDYFGIHDNDENAFIPDVDPYSGGKPGDENDLIPD